MSHTKEYYFATQEAFISNKTSSLIKIDRSKFDTFSKYIKGLTLIEYRKLVLSQNLIDCPNFEVHIKMTFRYFESKK